MTNFIEKHFTILMFAMVLIPCVIQLLPEPEQVTISANQDKVFKQYAAEAYKQIMAELK